MALENGIPTRLSASGLGRDLAASFLIFILGTPLAIGVATASGAPAGAGLIASTVGGLVVGSLQSSKWVVSGPSMLLALMVLGAVEKYGFAVACTLTMAAGLLQVILAWARVACLAFVVQAHILRGVLAGLGILVVLSQIHVFFGGTAHGSAARNLLGLPNTLATAHPQATALGVLTLVLIYVFSHVPRLVRSLGHVAAILCCTLVAVVLRWKVPTVSLGTFALGWRLPELPPQTAWLDVTFTVLALAFVGSAYGTLSYIALDKKDAGGARALRRNLTVQGLANVISGALGGLPLTVAAVRSAINRDAGARSRVSTVAHGLWMLATLLWAGPWLTHLPLSSLSALLLCLALKLVQDNRPAGVARQHIPAYLCALVGVLVGGLLVGVLLGVVAMLLQTLLENARGRVRVHQEEHACAIDVLGTVTFVTLPRLNAVFEAIPPGTTIRLALRTQVIDEPSRVAVSTWVDAHRLSGGRVVCGLRSENSSTPAPGEADERGPGQK